ncbi:MAG: HAMP domain-containing protein [Chloroflexi bacterium]|nr:HAMP domain-containing protein [Chloroflexota bacterium]
MFRSLNFRLLLSYVVVILVCLALVGLGLLLFVQTSPLWTSAAFLRLEAAAQATMPALLRAGSPETLTPEQFHAVLAQAAEDQGVRVLLLDREGTVRFDSGGDWERERVEEATRSPVVRDRVQGIFTAPTGGRWAFVGHVVPAPGDAPSPSRDGGRQIVTFVSPQSRLLMLAWFAENLLPPVIQAGAVALVFSVLLALLISRSVSAPLRRVAGAAESIARGETGTRAPVSGPSEVRGLARSFNTMADQVEAVQQSQRDLVANVSHELKTPLTSIQGFSQALLDGTASTPEATGRAARVIHEEAERMRRLVDELLVLARFDAGQMVMARAPVELGSLLQACVEKLLPQAQAADVALGLDVTEKLFVTGDGDRLAQVFCNLLDNSVAHTPAGGKVTVAARPGEERTVEVTVTDTGEGISAEALARIFERFYQVDKSRRSRRGARPERGRGAGLGLAIAKEIIKAHDGTITAESVMGLGTRFTVRLPAGANERAMPG